MDNSALKWDGLCWALLLAGGANLRSAGKGEEKKQEAWVLSSSDQ
jgi:hypothetical protein